MHPTAINLAMETGVFRAFCSENPSHNGIFPLINCFDLRESERKKSKTERKNLKRNSFDVFQACESKFQ